MFSPAPRRAKTKCLRIISRWLRQQPDGGNSGSAHCVDDAGHHSELQRRMAPDKRSPVAPHLENFSQPIVQAFPRHRFLVDAEGTVARTCITTVRLLSPPEQFSGP